MFTPIWGNDPIWRAYFFKRVGEKPPTRNPFTKYHAHTIHVWDIYLHLVDFLFMFVVNVGKYTIHGCYGMGPHPCRLGHFCFPCFLHLFEARCVSLPLQILWDFSRSLWCFRPGDISALLLGFQTLTVTWAVPGKHHRFWGQMWKKHPKNIPQKLCIRDLCSANCNCWVWSAQAYCWGYVKVADLSPIHVRKQSRHRW